MTKTIIFYFIFLLSFFSLLSSGVIDSQDGFQYLAVARNIYYQGRPTAPEYGYDTRENIHMSTFVAGDGNTYSPTGLGYSLAYLPAVAITDIVYKIYNVSPPIHFPLENDWLIFLTASFTNGFFASFLGVIIFLYLIELALSKKQALFMSLSGLFATNLLVYAKHSFPHMMFTSFLLLSFFFVKKYFKTKQNLFLVLSGLAFGVNSIIYNQTFLLAVVPLGFYFFLLSKPSFDFSSTNKLITGLRIKFLISKFLFFMLGLLPFIFIYLWFENLRSGVGQNLANPLDIANRGVATFLDIPKPIYFEAIFGQLFSPGRSIFLYSPILLLVIFFRHKIKKVILPETVVFFLLLIIYVFSFGSQRTFDLDNDGIEEGVAAMWHGESSWGPRYLTPLIPYGMLIVGFIFTKLKRHEKWLVFYPLLIAGLYINLLGVILPYQIKYHDLEPKFIINGNEFTNYTYSNFLPRYSPIIQMSKKLVKLVQALPQTLDHGKYNVSFYDGIDFPFPVGSERWRIIEGKGYISFDNPKEKKVRKISLGLINHPIEKASYPAVVKISLNNNILLQDKKLLPTERKLIELNIPENLLQDKSNKLQVNVEYDPLSNESNQSVQNAYKDDPSKYENKNMQPKKYIPQILGIISFLVNGEAINKESLDYPYVSTLGPALGGIKYSNYGGEEKDPWKSWHIHTQIYERVPDFWWFKFLYYWDIPKAFISLLFMSNILILIYTGFKTFRNIQK